MLRFVTRFISFIAVVGLFAVFVITHMPDMPEGTGPQPWAQDGLGRGAGIADIRAWQTPRLNDALAPLGARVGNPVYLRLFKEEAELELWVLTGQGMALFRTYPICRFSGDLGPKLREGDQQAPEGFYRVGRSALNPNSSFHLSFNLGYPNAYDRAYGRTGSFLMIHGDCRSVGCYAMTDPMIEQIYVLVEAALRAGQPYVDVHAFPFRMTDARMSLARDQKWYSFWTELKPAYDLFEATRRIPDTKAKGRTYEVAAR